LSIGRRSYYHKNKEQGKAVQIINQSKKMLIPAGKSLLMQWLKITSNNLPTPNPKRSSISLNIKTNVLN
jgi:hypothetical protein